MKITEAGIYPGLSSADYFADPCPTPSLTQSIAKVLIDQSELHARAEHPRFRTPDDDDEAEKYVKAQAIGNAAHLLMIGRGKQLEIVKADDFRGGEARKLRDTAYATGKTPILEKHFQIAHDMMVAARNQIDIVAECEPVLHEAFVNGDGEVMACAEADGIWLRSLIDWMVTPRLLFDFKTTGMSVAPHAVPNLMADAGWALQAAMQERILDVLDPEGAGRRRFFFIAQENYKPFALTVHELPEGTMTMGRKMLAKAEAMWRQAIVSDKWPGYAPVVHMPEYPGWHEQRWLTRELNDEAQRLADDVNGKRAPAKFDPEIMRAG